MRDERVQSRRPAESADISVPARWWRRHPLAASTIALTIVACVAGGIVLARTHRGDDAAATRPPSFAQQLDALELASIDCGAAFAESAAIVPPPAALADRAVRARWALAQAGLLLRVDRPDDAIARLDSESAADPKIVDAAWRSRRLDALRRAERMEEADAFSSEWVESLPEDHPERAWAIAELALHRALTGRGSDAEAIATPWLGRTLSPVVTVRLRIAEAILRSDRGDHAVAAAALADARDADAVCDARERIPCGRFVALSLELSEAASAAGETRAAIDLCEQGLSLIDAGPVRLELLRRHASACRIEAHASLEALASKPRGAADLGEVVATNRRFLSAAKSASELAERLVTDSGGDAPAVRAAAVQCAAECWERAGRVDDAVASWREWLRCRPDSDPERAAVLWRIAELLHGLQRFEESVDAYRMLMRIHPNSPQAALAPVAAARALRSLGEHDAAAKVLDEILSGRGGIDPESPAYTQALLERGRLAHANRQYEVACRRLEELLRREPFRADAWEIRLLLADSWRQQAIAAELAAVGPGAPSEIADTNARAIAAWRSAADEFASVVARLDARDLPAEDVAAVDRSRMARVGLAESLQACGRTDEATTAWEEVDRRHPNSESALVALDRLSRLPGADADAIRRRALRRLEAIEDDGSPRLLSTDAWKLWFETPRTLMAQAGGTK